MIECETQYLWQAETALRLGSVAAALEAIDDLEGIALHGAPRAAQAARDALGGALASRSGRVATLAGAALVRLSAT